MKTLLINENILNSKLLQETILRSKLPEDIMQAIDNRKLPFGAEDIISNSVIEKISMDGLRHSVEGLKKIKRIEGIKETDDLESVLGQLINKCIEIEKPFRDRLENICINYVIKLFRIPEDAVNLGIELVDNIDIDSNCIRLDSMPSTDSEEMSVSETPELQRDIFKRQILNALAMGAGLTYSMDIKSYYKEVADVNPELPKLYDEISLLNQYLLFTKDSVEMTEDNYKQLGVSTVDLCGINEKSAINVQGVIFPALLSETIRGIIELFSAHGLPKDLNIAKKVLQRADYLKSEPWEMRLGPGLWKLFKESYKEKYTKYLPYLYKKFVSLSNENFSYLMKEIINGTDESKKIMKILSIKALEDKIDDKLKTSMTPLNDKKGIITDEILKEEEL